MIDVIKEFCNAREEYQFLGMSFDDLDCVHMSSNSDDNSHEFTLVKIENKNVETYLFTHHIIMDTGEFSHQKSMLIEISDGDTGDLDKMLTYISKFNYQE